MKAYFETSAADVDASGVRLILVAHSGAGRQSVNGRVARIAGVLRARVLRARVLLTAAALCVACAAGCGPIQYAAQIDAATAKLAEARDANARWFAPFDYYYAEAHLAQARREAAEASYEEAITYAEIAERYSRRALRVALERGRAER